LDAQSEAAHRKRAAYARRHHGQGLWSPVLLAVVAVGRRCIIQPAALPPLLLLGRTASSAYREPAVCGRCVSCHAWIDAAPVIEQQGVPAWLHPVAEGAPSHYSDNTAHAPPA